MAATTRPLASPVVAPSHSSLRSTRMITPAVMSPSAMPRTTTVAVCVVPMPPIEATMGMKTARVASAWIDVSNRPMTEAASTAVPRLMSRHTRRSGNTARGGARGGLADVLDRLRHGGALVDGHEARGHEPSGGALAILEELLHLLGLLFLHEVEDLVRFLLGQLLDDLHHVIRRHVVEDAG